MADPAVLAQVFASSVSPDKEQRKQAEEFLRNAQRAAGFGLSVLQLAAAPGVEEHIRQAAAVSFKNHVKYHWTLNLPDGDGGAAVPVTIADSEKEQIKSVFVSLMLQMPPKIQAQLSEALTIISGSDFPEKWPSLMPELLSKMGSGDTAVVNGVLSTADSIFRRFRGQFKTVEVVRDLKFVLDNFVKPMLEVFTRTGAAVAAATSPDQLKQLLTSVLHILNIVYSLNNIDFPEVFEDTFDQWLAEFHKYLAYDNPALAEPDKPSIVDQVKASICENINLFLRIAEENIVPHVQGFATAVWHLLLKVGQEATKDELATEAIRFLTSIANSVHNGIFKDPDALLRVCENIVIPNLQFRESDQEIFDENYIEYVRRDVEGSDTDTRRRMASELVKALTSNFKEAVTAAMSGYVGKLLAEYQADPQRNWKQKDCAIFLITALTVRSKTDTRGATSTNELVNIGDFFAGHIVPELQQPAGRGSDLLKADALKFLTTFRQQIPKQTVLQLLPNVTALLLSEHNVVHSYAAICVERVLTVKDGPGARGRPDLRYLAADLAPLRDQLLHNLFFALTLPESGENDYLMKAIMRVVATLGPEVKPVAPTCMTKLAGILAELAKNPRNPSFSHYLFEAVAALIRHCGTDPALLAGFEGLLFPPFQLILSADVAEFAPYVFQIIAQLMECRTPPLPQAYLVLFPPLLSPVLWERRANVPALVRLLQAYLQRAGEEVVAGQHLLAVLGVFQRLISSKAHDHEGFFVLNTIVENLPPAAWTQHMPTIWGLLLTRLQNSRTQKYSRSFAVFFSLLLCKHGVAMVLESLERVQPNLFAQLVEAVWLVNLTGLSGATERKLAAVAGLKLLTEWPPLTLAAPTSQLWVLTLERVLAQLDGEEEEDGGAGEQECEPGESGYSAAYARLGNAAKQESDPLPEVKDARVFVAAALATASRAAPGALAARVAAMPAPAQASLAAAFQAAGVSPS